jgi:hypothetical protein
VLHGHFGLVGGFVNQIVPGEGILVAVVEARYRPIIASFAIGNMTFRSVHTQVPLKKTIALYR